MRKNNSSKKIHSQIKNSFKSSLLPADSVIPKGVFIKKVFLKNSYKEGAQNLETLHAAWNNLPSDFSSEERIVFLEIAEKIVKIHQRLKKLHVFDELEEKN